MTAAETMAAADPIVIRASALTMWPDCERRAAARMFKKIIESMGFELRETSIHVGAPIGSATHAGAAFELQRKIDTGDLAPVDESIDAALLSLDEELTTRGEIEWKPDTANNRDQAQKQVIRMLGMVHRHVAPGINPISVEKRLKADIGNGFELSGQKDIYSVERAENRPDIVFGGRAWFLKDLKTGAKPGLHMGQVGAYAVLARTHGLQVDGLDIIWLPRVPLKKRQPEPIVIPVPIEDAERTAERTYQRAQSTLMRFMETGDPNEFLPNAASVLCGDSCPAFGTDFCKAHREFS